MCAISISASKKNEFGLPLRLLTIKQAPVAAAVFGPYDDIAVRADDITVRYRPKNGGTLQRYNQQTGFPLDETASL
jgi:hypothetical protein